MTSPAPSGRARRGRLLPVYVGIIGLGLLTLILVLPAGRHIRPVRSLAPLLAVNQAAAPCLGVRLAVEQSGQFIELRTPGRPGSQHGSLVAAGRADRARAALDANGHCAPGTALAGQRLGLRLQLAAGTEPEITGQLTITGRPAIALDLARTAPTTGTADDGRLAAGDVAGRVFLAIAVLIVGARLVGSAFAFIGQPRVLGEIVSGILLGPSLLGAVLPAVTRHLFPRQVTDVLQVMAQLGLIFFLFLVGVAADLGQARKLGEAAVLISHVSIVAPFSLGVVTALVLFPVLGGGSFIGFALFMGAAMAITAFPVLARILTETGMDRTRLGALSIACAAIDDVTAWCVLAVVVAVVRSSGGAHVAQVIGLSAVFAAGVVFLVGPVLRRLVQRYEAAERANAPLLAGLIALLLLCAFATESIGTHAVFGAFTLGVVVPRSPRLTAELAEKLESVTAIVLLPIFFAVVGLSTRIGLMTRSIQWWSFSLIVVVAVFGKWGGSAVAGRLTGLPWREANALGILMNTRGLTEIVILSVGQGLGVVSPALFTMMVLMALLTTFMTTPLLSAFYPVRHRRT